MSADDAFKMATCEGAAALGFDNTGDIKEGMCADMVLIDIDKPHFYPMHDLRSNIIFSAGGADVWATIADGRLLYKDGEFKTADFERIKFNIEKCKERLFDV